MPDYQHGKIYKVVDLGYEQCYIGSNCEDLCRRMASHRGNYKKYQNGHKNAFNTVYSLFDTYGVENCKIELIETFPCQSREELFKQEGINIRNAECVNRNMSGRTPNERYEDKKEEILTRQKLYRDTNQDKIKQRNLRYYEANKEN